MISSDTKTTAEIIEKDCTVRYDSFDENFDVHNNGQLIKTTHNGDVKWVRLEAHEQDMKEYKEKVRKEIEKMRNHLLSAKFRYHYCTDDDLLLEKYEDEINIITDKVLGLLEEEKKDFMDVKESPRQEIGEGCSSKAPSSSSPKKPKVKP